MEENKVSSADQQVSSADQQVSSADQQVSSDSSTSTTSTSTSDEYEENGSILQMAEKPETVDLTDPRILWFKDRTLDYLDELFSGGSHRPAHPVVQGSNPGLSGRERTRCPLLRYAIPT
ncbi:uncharacterized protein LOC113471560 [Diaphorina citri]|uniref:Uncharacterized protein LOC113471560 n=1 Tax=Diaphorina citri TaxID=121845 RepID=A0A3Q0JHM1_DIACI|nr:uncharacterized protein LOC113471560 [Diaphorina citri]